MERDQPTREELLAKIRDLEERLLAAERKIEVLQRTEAGIAEPGEGGYDLPAGGSGKAKRSVAAERHLFFNVLETLPVYVCLLTPDYHVPFVNRVFRERFGASTGLRCFEHLFERSEPCEICETFSVLRTGRSHQWEWAGPDGCYYNVFDFPFTDTDGSRLILEMGIDITERKKAESELRTTIEKLEKLNQELQDFAFISSHDLQEPLRKIQTFGDMLVGRYADSLDSTAKDYLGRMTRAAKRMSELLRSLLDYSRTGTHELNYRSVSLSGVARDAVNNLEILINTADGKVEIEDMPTVEADAVLLRQLFQNLIENSIKYRKPTESPIVRVNGTSADGVCRITVEDNGIGFDERYSDQVFKPFERLHGKSSTYGGTGMGLAICRKIVDRHGGDIMVESVAGQGTRIIVFLPEEQGTGARWKNRISLP